MLSRKSTLTAAAIATTLFLGACADNATRTAPRSMSSIAVPESGITSVQDVVIKPGSKGTIRFEATSAGRFSMNSVLAILYCRAAAYRDDNGFAAMQVETIERMGGSRPQSPEIISAELNFYNDPVPGNVKPLTHDWCPEVPEAARNAG